MKIKYIKMKNIINFKDEITISYMDDSKYSDLNFEKSYLFNSMKMLSKIGIIGKNASGKTTIVRNIKLIKEIIDFSFFYEFVSHFIYIKYLKIVEIAFKTTKHSQSNIIKNKNFEFSSYIKDLIDNWDSEFLCDSNWEEYFNNFISDREKNIEYNVCFYDENNDKNTFISIEINMKKPLILISMNNKKYIFDINEIIKKVISKEDFISVFENPKGKKQGKLERILFFDIGDFLQIQTKKFINNKSFFKKESKQFENFSDLIFVLDANYFFEKFYSINNEDKRKKTIANILKYTNKNWKNKKNELLKWIKMSDDSIIDLRYNNVSKKYEGFINNKGQNINIDQLSDGTKKWLLVFDFIFSSPFELIVFDEIENSLHLKLTKTLINSFVTVKKQLLFTTHNPLVFYKKYRPNGVYYIDKDENDNKILIRLNKQYKVKKKHSISELIKKEIIGLHPETNVITDFFDLIGEDNE